QGTCRILSAHFRWEAKLPFGPQSGLPLSYMHRGKQYIVFAASGTPSNLLRRLRLEFDDVVMVNHVPNLYRAATDFAVFDICLASNRHIEDDRDLLAAVRTSEEVFHKLLVWY